MTERSPRLRLLVHLGARFQLTALILLTGCGGGGGGGSGQLGPSDYAVGGSISGLVDTGLVISNGSDTLTIAAGATVFTMPKRADTGESFALAVKTQPPGQTCILSGGTGTAGAGSATAALVSCDQWTWQGGSATNDPAATYGTLGVPAAGNVPGGLLLGSTWTDFAGDLWLFGGLGTYASGDHWQLDAASGHWAWMGSFDLNGPYPGTQGVPDPAILPRARYNNLHWQDPSGDQWIYGGLCSSGGCMGVLGDLWRFHADTLLWTWEGNPVTANQATVYGMLGVADAAASPGSRFGAVTWVDTAGNLWLHGGWSYDGNTYTLPNDDWKYDRVTERWAWMGGSALSFQASNYGASGVAPAANSPGSRLMPQQWIDNSGQLWLFGGTAYDATAQGGRANDLWQLDRTTGWWTWIGGPTTLMDAGMRGQRGVPAATNWPSARDGAVTWVDAAGNLWMYGGTAHFTTGAPTTNQADDLWRYNPATGAWTWMSGTGLPDAAAVHGSSTGHATAGLTPGSRYSGMGWTDGTGTFWLFGGGKTDAGGTTHALGDFWSYRPPRFPAGQ